MGKPKNQELNKIFKSRESIISNDGPKTYDEILFYNLQNLLKRTLGKTLLNLEII